MLHLQAAVHDHAQATGLGDLRPLLVHHAELGPQCRPDYSWLDEPVLDDRGRLRHDGGVTGVPGLYALGLPVLRRRSTFLHGIEDDARDVVDHLVRTVPVSAR